MSCATDRLLHVTSSYAWQVCRYRPSGRTVRPV